MEFSQKLSAILQKSSKATVEDAVWVAQLEIVKLYSMRKKKRTLLEVNSPKFLLLM